VEPTELRRKGDDPMESEEVSQWLSQREPGRKEAAMISGRPKDRKFKRRVLLNSNHEYE